MKGSGELGLRMNNFYVEINSSLMHTMNIPNKFAKMFVGSMSENIELEGPSGYTWHVKIMMRSDNTFVLQSGWKEFVTANKIVENDFIVFTYKDNSTLKVLIFDRTGCEKVTPFFAKNTNTEPEKEIISQSSGSSDTDESSREISTRAAQARIAEERVCGKRKQRAEAAINSDTLHQQDSKLSKMESEESKGSLIREIAEPYREVKQEIISLCSASSDTDESSCWISPRAPQARMTGERVCGKRKQRDFVQELTESESNAGKDNRATKASRPYFIPCGTHLTQAQKEIANTMARNTQKDSHLLVKILNFTDTPPYRHCRLRIPVAFACKVLKSKKMKITLLSTDLDKRSKTCTANYSKNKSEKCIGQGWRKFACKNGLKQGDLCLFELRKQEKLGILTMVVHFNRGSS